MSDGHGSTPGASGTPPGWASNQPPPYGNAPGSPWTAPGPASGTPEAPPQGPPPGPGQPHGQAPDQWRPYQQGRYGPPLGARVPPPAMRPGIIPLRPLGLGDILDGAIKLMRSNPKSVLGLSAIAAALGAIPLAVGQVIVLNSLTSATGDLDATPPEGSFLTQYGGTLLSYAVQFVAVTLLTGVLTRILGRAVFGGKLTAGEAWTLTRSRVPTLFGLVVVNLVLLLVPMALIVGLFLALGAAGAGVAVVAIVGVVAVLAYVIYAFFVTTRLVLAPSAAVLERRGVADSLRRSWHLVSGGFWRTLGIVILTQIIAFLIGQVLAFPFVLGGSFFAFLGAGSIGAQVAAAVLIAVGVTLGSMITYPLQAGVNGLLYADRRMRSEAFDLVLQTAAIEQQRQGWVHASADDLWDPSVTPPGPARYGPPDQGAPWSHS
ncbi:MULTISPECIES: hypothetical protein [unclassified Streptosporangium]|uniref:hypothetical protein n=1 Tax=unclassified Streptosporangium TaxID=2632669 RepID=UPI002E2DB7AD|nr:MULTISPECIES: hypothetical protein [unclassified Streptosporangium]